MESLWQKAKSFAEEAAKRSQTLTTSPAKIADIVSETAKRSKDFAAEASKKADELKSVADLHIKSLADQIPSLSLSGDSDSDPVSDLELQSFGITDDLKHFVKGLTTLTFQSFPIQDDLQGSDVGTVSNVRQDLSEWQQKHATLVLTTVKEISRLRYELCPRHMKDQRFWRIYFTLVNSQVAPYEKKYVEEIKLKETEKLKDDKVERTPIAISDGKGTSLISKTSTSSNEQDLDTFLLGGLEDSDAEPGTVDDDENFDDDFDKIDNSDVEDGK